VHHAHVEAGRELPTARAAFWIGFRLIPLGELGRAQPWLARRGAHRGTRVATTGD
jgi:hypothetical protein